MTDLYRAIAFSRGLGTEMSYEIFSSKDLLTVLAEAENKQKKKKQQYAVAIIRVKRKRAHVLVHYLKSKYCKYDFPRLYQDERDDI